MACKDSLQLKLFKRINEKNTAIKRIIKEKVNQFQILLLFLNISQHNQLRLCISAVNTALHDGYLNSVTIAITITIIYGSKVQWQKVYTQVWLPLP